MRTRTCAVVFLIASSQTSAQASEWSAPEHLGCVVNSPFNDTGPALSRDGKSLFFGSQRPGGAGSFDLWVSHRPEVDAPWGVPVNLGPAVNTANIENIPVLSPDQHWLFFNSNRHRPGQIVDVDVYASYREDIHDDFGWQTPINLGAGINTAGFDAGASVISRGRDSATLFFSRGPDQNTTDIYVSEGQLDGSFGVAVLIPELSDPEANDQRPSVRHTGRELFLHSNRKGSFGGNDIWTSTRRHRSDAWGTPANPGPVINGPFNDAQAHISHDGRSLFFISDRPSPCGGAANLDLYVSTRNDAAEDEDDGN